LSLPCLHRFSPCRHRERRIVPTLAAGTRVDHHPARVQIELLLNAMAIWRYRLAIKDPRVLRWLSVADLVVFPSFTLGYIWRLQFIARWSWVIFALWLLASFTLHGDTLKGLGWRVDNLWPATREALKVFLLLTFGMIILGFVLQGPRAIPASLLSLQRLGGYYAFCLLQQVALNSLIQNRALSLIQSEWGASLFSGAIFGAMHLPNPVLAPATFLVGTLTAWLFARQRNILPLAAGQAVLGTLAAWTFPAAWIHHLRVGPGYYTWHR